MTIDQQHPPAAIPGRYRNTQFRSRLEIRWAALFDLLQWGWDYETLTLPHRIPDFVMHFSRPTIIEAKPAFTVADIERERRALIAGAADWLCEEAERRLRELDAQERAVDPITQRAELLEIDALVSHISYVRDVGDNETWHIGRRALVVGAQLLPATEPWFARADAFTVDGFHVFAYCNGCKSGVGLFNHRGCIACGREGIRPVPIPSSDMLLLWREASNHAQWNAPGAPA